MSVLGRAALPFPVHPEYLRSALNTTEVVQALFAVFFLLFAYDAAHNRLGSSNGKFISFVDTCINVAAYRHGLPESRPLGMGVWRTLRIAAASFFVKFASSTTVSLLLGKVPIVLSNTRHAAWFFLGFGLMWFSPEDAVYSSIQRSPAVRLCLGMGAGLYKMRKAIFAVEAAWAGGGGFPFALLVMVLAVDGNTLARRGLFWLQARLATPPPKGSGGGARWLSMDITLQRLYCDGSHGAWRTLSGTLLPLSGVTASVWLVSRWEWAAGITDDSFLGLRAVLLALFIWRAGTFHELANIHAKGLAVAEATEAQAKVVNEDIRDCSKYRESVTSFQKMKGA